MDLKLEEGKSALALQVIHWCHKLTPNEPDLILLLKQGPAAQDKDSSVGSIKPAVISGFPPGSTINFPHPQFCLHKCCLQSVIFSWTNCDFTEISDHIALLACPAAEKHNTSHSGLHSTSNDGELIDVYLKTAINLEVD